MDKRPPFYQSYQRVSFLLSPLCSFPTRTLFHSAKKDLLRVSFKFFLFSFFFRDSIHSVIIGIQDILHKIIFRFCFNQTRRF